ncbi:PepSY-associated TM helix domain-containing protein [Fulvivirgaceae bacterium BMA10]|uniref:PepSY-associated TM helix domain-containing protein n=1 Tax=Splendidivirga corallicola TaxID=3051826 RepID=A0ABT8KQR6_9BACT|nr:PepSY-associated TM helix domain-containing protein [Fulvivirgaceae bacterium BMA10]
MKSSLKRAARHQKHWYGKWHTWAGITAGMILIIVSLTGSFLVFEDELDVWLNPELFDFEEKGQAILSFQNVITKLKEDYPDWDMGGIYMAEKRNHAYILYLHDGEQAIINPYTAEVTGVRIYRESVMGFIRHLHRTLFIPPFGKYLVGTSSLICAILMITGLRLWIPKKWKHLKARFGIRWSGNKKRINFDLHNSLGFYFSPVITLISITGVVITFSQFVFLFLFLLSFKSPQSIASIFDQKSNYYENAKALSIDELEAIVEKQVEGGILMGINFPHDSVGTYGMNVLAPAVAKTGDHCMFWLDQYSGEVVYSSESKDLKLGKMYLNWITPIHYGTFGGLPTRILALIASLVTATLFITGFIIWLPRWKKSGNISIKRVSVAKKTKAKAVENELESEEVL